MATGDPIIFCTFCKKNYYLTNGHKCSCDFSSEKYTADTNTDLNLAPPINWTYCSITRTYESDSTWEYFIKTEYEDGDNEFTLSLYRNAYKMIELNCKTIYYNDCLELLKKIAETEHFRSLLKDKKCISTGFQPSSPLSESFSTQKEASGAGQCG